jgi:hypothetical protein
MMNDSQQLRELMWDLVYGLLSDEETQALIARVKSEPNVARLYAEVQLQAELVNRASRVEDSSVVLSPATTTSLASAKSGKQKASRGRSSIGPKADSHRGGAWLAGIGVTSLAALLAVGIFWPRPSERQLAQNFVAADVTATQPIQAGLTNQLAVRTYFVSADRERDEETSASVELRLIDRTGQERFRKSVSTGENGQATVDIPGSALEPGVRLELAAAPAMTVNLGDQEAEVRDRAKSLQYGWSTVELPVEPEPQMSYVLVSEPQADGDKAAQFSVWTFSAFSATLDSPAESLSVVAGLPVQTKGTTRMLVDELNKATPSPAAPTKDKARLISAAEPVTVTIPPELAGKSLALAATCRGVTVATTNAPEFVPASKNTTGKAVSSGDQISLALPPEADGLIEIEVFDRSLGESPPVHREQVYREPTRRLQIDLPNVAGRYAPGQEVELALQVTDERGQPAANTRVGVRVWNERVVRQSNEQPMLLADAVHSGTSRFEYLGKEPAQLGQRAGQATGGGQAQASSYRLARRQEADEDAAAIAVAKPSARESLQEEGKVADAFARSASIELASNRDAVQIALREAVDQAHARRQRTMAIVGGTAIFGGITLLVLLGILAALRKWVSIQAMTPAFIAAVASLFVGLIWVGWWPTSGLQQIAMAPAPAETASAPANRADDPAMDTAGESKSRTIVRSELTDAVSAPSEAAPARGPALAATPAAPLPPAAEPADRSLGLSLPDAQRAGRAASLNESIAPESNAAARGGEPLSSLSRSNAKKKAEPATTSEGGVPGAFGASSAGRLAAGGTELAPASQLRARAAGDAGAKESRDNLEDKKSDAAAAPPSLYFNPQLLTDANGLATIRFVMPPVDSEYRVLIDALGQGRIGSRQAMIVGSGAAAAAK